MSATSEEIRDVGTGTTGLVADIITRLANCATVEQVASIIKNLK